MRDQLAIILSLSGLMGCAPITDDPWDEGFDPKLLVADVTAGQVVEVQPFSGGRRVLLDAVDVPQELAPDGLQPAGMAWQPDALLLTDMSSGRVLAFDPDDGLPLGLVFDPGPDANLEEPCALARVDGALAVLGNDTRNVLLLHDDGWVDELGGSSPPEIRDGHALLALPEDRLLVATSPGIADVGLLQLWSPRDGRRLQTWQLPGGALSDATGLALGPDGLVYEVDWSGAQLLRVDPADGAVVDQVLGPQDLTDPVALAFDPSGRLWILERRGLVTWSPSTGAERVLDDAFDFGRGLLVVP